MKQSTVADGLRDKPGSILGFLREAGTRETIESILVAVMLALLFKAFETEAFVIPTGSMAPTLQGLHKDVFCDQCGYEYRVSASSENPDVGFQRMVTATTCPICRYTQGIDAEENVNESSFDGDRIVVNKFAYDIAEPQRWEVVVFRYPLNAKQPYIKRLVGLPNEILTLLHGDVFVQPNGNDDEISPDRWTIARKDHRKLLAMLQPVDDTYFVAEALVSAKWPSRWQQWDASAGSPTWTVEYADDSRPSFHVEAGEAPAWLRYRHLVPRRRDWDLIEQGQVPPRILDSPIGEAITDYYEYNDGFEANARGQGILYHPDLPENDQEMASRGLHWVGDLAVEVDVEVSSQSGTLLLDLVEGGVHYVCQFDLASGSARAWANRGPMTGTPSFEPRVTFDGIESAEGTDTEPVLTAATSVRGAGTYHLRFANCDDRLYLWVNESPVEFDHPGTFTRQGPLVPTYSEGDPGDAEPAGVGAQGAKLTVDRLRISRDIYYISVESGGSEPMDYGGFSPRAIRRVLDAPESWSTTEAERLFYARDKVPALFELQTDQFFMMGDNSPHSSDARMWSQKYVHRKDLIGKAVFIFWPHSWWRPVPFWPRFSRMRFIR